MRLARINVQAAILTAGASLNSETYALYIKRVSLFSFVTE